MEAGSLYRLASIDSGRPGDETDSSPAERIGEIDVDLAAVENRVAVDALLTATPPP